jgi:hypothetical protein
MQRHLWNSLGLRIESGRGYLSCFIYDDIASFDDILLIIYVV